MMGPAAPEWGKRDRTLLDALEEVGEIVRSSENQRSLALVSLGHAMGLASSVGWTPDELREAIGSW